MKSLCENEITSKIELSIPPLELFEKSRVANAVSKPVPIIGFVSCASLD